jgi:predicted amidophosphoribosyltransferase
MLIPDEYRWRKTDESVELFHCPEHTDLGLYYARTYTIGQGYRYSSTNQLVLNLKISPNQPADRLVYKNRAIVQCAREVAEFFTQSVNPDLPIILVPMPPSKTRSHPEYDDRMEQVAQQVDQRCSNVMWAPLLETIINSESYHTRSEIRDPDDLYRLMSVQSNQTVLYNAEAHIVLIDDILTSGLHFSVARRHLLEHFENAPIHGIFWAKADRAKMFSA